MATDAYHAWVRAGRPWSEARPIRQLEAWARANDVPVLGTIGNLDHLTADWPEDHTPFSFTAWPVPLPGYIVCAIDLADVRGLGNRLLAMARAGRLSWLKYMNVDFTNYAYADGFQQGAPNSDAHIHLSIFSDDTGTSIGDDFDPWQEQEEGDVDLKHIEIDMVDERDDDRWWAGKVIGKNKLNANQAAMYAAMSPFYIKQEVLPRLKAAEKRDKAILDALGGLDTAAILARIEQRAAEDAARDAELADLVQRAGSGQLSAEAVVQRLGEILVGAPAE